MSLKSIFLTLSIKNQICISIIAFIIFCLIVILSIFGSLTYEILNEDYKQKKLYFYEKFKDYIESSFYFENFCLLQYEEIIKRIQIQLWEHLQVTSIYDFEFNININENNKLSIIPLKSMNITNDISIINDNNILFYSCLDPQSDSCASMKNKLLNEYNTLSSLFACQDLNNILRIPI